MAKSKHGSRSSGTGEAAMRTRDDDANPSCSMFSPSLPGRAMLPGSPLRLTRYLSAGAVDASVLCVRTCEIQREVSTRPAIADRCKGHSADTALYCPHHG